MMRLVVLVDGEHHPPAVRAVIDELASGADEVVGAVFCGGSEKVDTDALDDAYGVRVARGVVRRSSGVRTPSSGEDLAQVLQEVIRSSRAGCVVDLTDEPVLSPDDRFRLGSVALAEGAVYRGADFDWRPPVYEPILSKASVSVFATGKRTGKTAVASALARRAVASGRRPVIVAVGRGGPPEPVVVEPGSPLDAEHLVAMADGGRHAASDYVEDAVTSGVATIGCRRVGGGLAGAPFRSNVADAARLAESRDEDLVILEGSGASIVPVAAGAKLVCVPATIDPVELRRFFNPYRLLLADLAVVTMCADDVSGSPIQTAIRATAPDLDVIHVGFRPEPLSQVDGRRVFFCSTAAPGVDQGLKGYLEEVHKCEVVGMTHRLSDRSALIEALEAAPDHDVLLTEVKAAAIDVAARRALDAGREVVFVDNALVGRGVEDAFDRLLHRATETP